MLESRFCSKKVLTQKSEIHTHMSSSSTKSLLFGVFASAMIASFALASENAHVLLHQTVSKDAFVQGENVTVAVTATNAGLANARNVVIKAPSNRNGGKWTQVNEESLETKLTSLDVGETKEMTYVYNVKDAGTYTVEPVAIQYFASETREVTKGESNVVKNVKVLTPMQNNARKVLRVTGFFSLGALNTVEDWVKFSKWIAGTIALFLLNWVALKIKYGVQSLRRMAAVRGLEGDAKLE